MMFEVLTTIPALSATGGLPALGALPTLSPTTVFLMLLSLCAIVTVWGVMQLLSVMRGGDENIERRLGLGAVTKSLATDSALLRPEERKQWLGQSEGLARLANRLDLVFPGQTLAMLAIVSLLIALVAGGLVTLVLGIFPYGLLAGFGAGMIPYLRFKMAYNKRRKILADQLIEALDFLSRVLRAGHSLASGLNMIGEELPEPIGGEFRRCYEQHNLGLSLEAALTDMAKRVDLDDFAFFVTSVSIQRQTGGDLAEILDNINGMIRSRIRLAQHVQALTAEGRATGYVLTALPILIFLLMLVMNPDYGGELLRRNEGRLMLLGAIMLQVLGLLTIRKIVNVRV